MQKQNEKASGCLDAWHLNGGPVGVCLCTVYLTLSLMKQMWTVHRLKTSVKFRIEFMVPSGTEYLDGCQMWQIAWVLTPRARESNRYLLTVEEKRPDCRHYREEIHLAIKIIVIGWAKCPYGWVTLLFVWIYEYKYPLRFMFMCLEMDQDKTSLLYYLLVNYSVF